MSINKQEIAVVGVAFRFPGDLEDDASLWEVLKHKKDMVTQVPNDRWADSELKHPRRSEPGSSVTFAAGSLSRIDEFDAAFFGISPREAAWLDPQQRLLLELSWEAMENAGVRPSQLSGSDCAVYVGISSLDYGMRALGDLASISSHSMTGNTLSMAANRLSYFFDLHGPSLAVDTACSSSLVALHHACKALQTGEAGAALVGGVNLMLHPHPFVGFTKASMLSAEGLCKTFDASANGYVRAEGGAVLLLKPLDRAVADGDDIKAVILATGVNADGARKTGITIPSRDGQIELLRKVLGKTNLSAWDIDFFEAHGTGTMLGDPIEAAAIGAVYGKGRKVPLPIGSVKANLGHLEAASGMAGLVKTILALQHRGLPPQLHLNTPNPRINFAGLSLQPVMEYQPLKKAYPLIAGVNSFGFGGTNAHLLLREYSNAEANPDTLELFPPLFLSARTDAALRALADRYSTLIRECPPEEYYDITFGAAHRRDRLEKRLVLHLNSPKAVAEVLSSFAQGGAPIGLVLEEKPTEAGGVAFIYSGNGAQWVGMGLQLMAESNAFADILIDLDASIRAAAGFSLLAELRATGDACRLGDTVVAQPLLFALQVAITRLLKQQGIEPLAVSGHSVGEVAAAWACGVLDLESAIRVIVARSRAQGETRGTGKMAAVGISVDAMQAVMAELGEPLDITIACINSPKNLTLSGTLADLKRVQLHLAAKGYFFDLLDLDYAFHCPQMDPLREPLLASLAGLKSNTAASGAFVSTVTGSVIDGNQLGAEYWWRNVREPVLFSQAVTELIGLGCRTFIEISPHAILHRYILESLTGAGCKGRVLPTLRKDAGGANDLSGTVLRAHLLADDPDLRVFFPQSGQHVQLPNYPWQRERHWHPRTNESLLSIERRRIHPLLGWRIPEAANAWENTLDTTVLPWLADHQVGGAVVFPGAAYAEMALAAAREWLGGHALAFEEMDIFSPMVFDGEHARRLRFELNDRDGSFQVKSRQRLSQDDWTLHAAGRILQPTDHSPRKKIPPVSAGIQIDRQTHYRLTTTLGLEYGPSFQGLREAYVAADCLHAELDYSADLENEGYLVHPALLDVCYQSLVDFFRADIEAGQGVAFLPVKTGRLEYHGAGKISRLRFRITRRSARSVLADFEVLDDKDALLISVSGCRFRAVPLTHKVQEKVSHWRIDAWLRPHRLEGLETQLPAPQALVDTLRLAMREHVEHRSSWFKGTLPLFEALVVSFAFEAFRTIIQKDRDALQVLLTSKFDFYALWLRNLLEQEGLLSLREGQWQLAEGSDLPVAEEIWRAIASDKGSALPQLVLLGRVGRHLPNLLLNPSERDGFLEVLRRSPVAETIFQDDPSYVGVRQAVQCLLRHLANDWPAHRRLRVLEIADGQSEIPRALLAALPEDRLDYVLALPEAVAESQRAEYGHAPNVVIATLDKSNWGLMTDASLPDHFDVVILRHTLHRANSPKTALTKVKHWLAAGSCLMVVERQPNLSADFLSGLANDWWHETTGAEVPHSSLAPAVAWVELLRAEGFEDVIDYEEQAAEGLAVGAYLLLARAPLTWRAVLPCPEPASWLFLVDAASHELATQMAARLESQGQRVATAQNLPQVLDGIDHVVHLRGWDDAPETAMKVLVGALGNVQAMGSHSLIPPRLWFITRGGALVSNLSVAAAPNSQQAALWGFARVVMNEYPALECTLIDLGSKDGLDQLENELLYPDGACEILLTDTGRYTLVMREVSKDKALRAVPGERFRLDFHLPGQLRNLVWLPQEVVALSDDAIEVEVQATALNFRDVMYLMGLLPDEAVEKGFAGASLGLEFAGIVSRVGSHVSDFRLGDKVMGFGSACFASHVISREDAVVHMPEEWSFESAATVPTVFFTVYYALKHLADLQAGERVLIHAGAGGVGIAAIQFAKYLGAEVFATAGSDEKRDFVHLLGADHVFDSRSLTFAEDVLDVTLGEGVDVVLNSLTGEAIRRNLSVLKPFGRFLELGKRDFFENTPIGLRPFKDNISYFGIDADQLLTGRPHLAARMFREVMALFGEGAFRPLPCRIFSAERVVDAFRTMQQANHIGKVVVSLADALPLVERPVVAQVPLHLAKNRTWIVTGGLSGLGLESARWLATHGVEHLVLVGRRGLDTPGAAEAVGDLTAKGVQVQVLSLDITDPAAVVHMVQLVSKTFPLIQGVLHAAAVFDDALIQSLDADRMHAVVAPKLLGAWNLHQATLDVPLEHFVLYSSITTAIGNPGQANYVAANAGLEGLVHMRRHLNLPAVCIGWGPIGDAGYLTRNEAARASLEQRLGRPPFRTLQALDELDSLIPQFSSLSVANFDWNTLSRLLPSATRGRFSVLNRGLKSTGLLANEVDFQSLITGKSTEEVSAVVQQFLVTEVSQVLAISVDRIDPEHNLLELGLDSLMAVELALALEKRFGIQFPVMILNESPTVEKVASRIVEKLLGNSHQDSVSNVVDATVVQGITQQHGEALAKEDIAQITNDIIVLQQKGASLTS